MYKILSIGGKEYKLEYTVRASLYEECVEKMINLFGSTAGVIKEENLTKGLNQEDRLKVQEQLLDSLRKQIYSLPGIALTLFYAGLMEHHGTGKNGDRTICSKDDAEELIYAYFEDHKEDGEGTFADILAICVKQMEEDGFFMRTGIEKILSQVEKTEENPKPNRATRRARTKASGK